MVFANISHISVNFHNHEIENADNLVTPWLKIISSTHSSKLLTGALAVVHKRGSQKESYDYPRLSSVDIPPATLMVTPSYHSPAHPIITDLDKKFDPKRVCQSAQIW